MNDKKVAVVFGASKGIGFATAELFASKGYKVYGVSRSGTSAEGVTAISADITDFSRLNEVYENIYAAEGKIDVVVNNAGLGISGAVEFTTDEQVAKILSLNFSALEKSCRLAAKYLRETKGKIINLSSVAGALPIPFQSYYTATKAAVLEFSRAYNLELRPYGVKVCAVLPGDTKTAFTASRDKNELGAEVYGDRIKRSVSRMERDETHGVAPIKVAKVVYSLAKAKNPKPYKVVGFGYKFLVVLARLLPTRLVDYILYSMYAK